MKKLSFNVTETSQKKKSKICSSYFNWNLLFFLWKKNTGNFWDSRNFVYVEDICAHTHLHWFVNAGLWKNRGNVYHKWCAIIKNVPMTQRDAYAWEIYSTPLHEIKVRISVLNAHPPLFYYFLYLSLSSAQSVWHTFIHTVSHTHTRHNVSFIYTVGWLRL